MLWKEWARRKLRAARCFITTRSTSKGLVRWANLIIATGQNNLAMNRSVLQVAKHFVRGRAT